MEMKLSGYTDVDFTSDDGKDIKGTSLFVVFKDERVTGLKTDKLFVRSGIELPALKPGDVLEVFFDMRGKVESVKTTKS